MINSYKARIVGEHIDWLCVPPSGLSRRKTVTVDVMVLDTILTASAKVQQGKKLAEILSKLADMNAIPEMSDPSAWQREIRDERLLPGRD